MWLTCGNHQSRESFPTPSTTSIFASVLDLGFTLNRLNSGLNLFRNHQEQIRTLIRAGDSYVLPNVHPFSATQSVAWLLGIISSWVDDLGDACNLQRLLLRKIQCQQDPLVITRPWITLGGCTMLHGPSQTKKSPSNFARFGFQPSKLFQVWSE